MKEINHSLVLNLHQPANNLEALLDENSWEANEILYAIDRIPRTLWGYEDHARVHLSLSGTLLETLSSPEFQQRVYGIVDCGSLLWYLQNLSIIRILGTGYYHPVLPLIPEADRKEQTSRWLGLAQHLFHRTSFQGFWPPEMAFSMELIPLLKQMGYRYVVVDSNHVEAVTPMDWHELRYRPHIARYGKDEMIIVVRDRELSDAQESGMDADWFIRELNERTKYCDFIPLVTTCTDGDNGGWFRNHNSSANFWGMYQTLLNQARDGGNIQPTFIDDYLDRHGVHGEVTVNTGAWNTGWHNGHGFVQWTGSQAQKDAISRVALTSKAVHDARWKVGETGHNAELEHEIEQALWKLLRAETSCNFYWGEDWVYKAHQDLDEAWQHLNNVNARLK